MNSLALFIGGLLLGVLLSLSFVNRMNPISSAGEVTVGNKETITTAFDSKSSVMKENKNGGNVTVSNIFSLQEKISTAEKSLATSTDSKIVNNIDLSSKPRWAPGKEGNSFKLKSMGNDALSNSVDKLNLQPKLSEFPVDESTIDSGKKSLRGKMKRKFLKEKAAVASAQQQLDSPLKLATISTDENTESTSLTVVALRNIPPVGSVLTVSPPTTVTSVPTSDTFLVSRLNASLPRLSLVSNPFIPYHNQATRDFEVFKAFIPSLDTMSANKLVQNIFCLNLCSSTSCSERLPVHCPI